MKRIFQGLLLPMFAAAFPILYLYGHNAWALGPSSLKLPLAATLIVVAVVYGLFLLVQRRPAAASLSATIFVVFYYFYGTIYSLLVKKDWVTVEHYTLLPLVLVVVVYLGILISRVKPSIITGLQKVLLLTTGALVALNLGIIGTAEMQKSVSVADILPAQRVSASPPGNYPDIYYIVFDEYAGFDAVHGYWKLNYVDDFAQYLKDHNFFIANGSRSPTLSTITELTSRLNLHQYPEKTDAKITVQAIRNNKVMRILKSYGYKTVVMEMAFEGIKADYHYEYAPEQIHGFAPDEFRKAFLDKTMFNAFSSYLIERDPPAEKQREIIMYSLDKTADLPGVPSPKFVYTHLLLPHEPFIFDKDGNLIDSIHADDWNYYIGQHEYTTKLAMELVDKIMAQADPNNPPVIILQSDHGARNLMRRTNDKLILNGFLENYDMAYAHDILNALYLPGFDYSQLDPAMPPIDTFKIVLNHYLDAGVTVDTEKVKEPSK